MRYVGTVFRPPSEAGSLLVQATIGCPHNKCRFCGMYKNKRFRIRPEAEIMEDLEAGARVYGGSVRTLFLPDGNTIIMKTRVLARVLRRARELFPKLERITMYGSARFINVKSDEELAELKAAGLDRVHMGLESGDDETLAYMKKGATAAESEAAGVRIREADIELSAYYLVGLGGRERLEQHAAESARVLSAISPEFIRLRTYYPVPQAPLYEDIQSGRFELPGPLEALRELKILIENLEARSMLLSDHVSNYVNLSGRLPDDRPELLAELETALAADESRFRRVLHNL